MCIIIISCPVYDVINFEINENKSGQKFKYLKNKKSFNHEIKNLFHHFWSDYVEVYKSNFFLEGDSPTLKIKLCIWSHQNFGFWRCIFIYWWRHFNIEHFYEIMISSFYEIMLFTKRIQKNLNLLNACVKTKSFFTALKTYFFNENCNVKHFFIIIFCIWDQLNKVTYFLFSARIISKLFS